MTRIHSILDKRSFPEPGEIRSVVVSAERQFHTILRLTRGTGYDVGLSLELRCRFGRKNRAVACAPHRSAR